MEETNKSMSAEPKKEPGEMENTASTNSNSADGVKTLIASIAGVSSSPASPLLPEEEESLAPSSQVSCAIKATNRDSVETLKTRTVGESTSPSSPLRLEEAEERLAPSSQVSCAIKATNRDSVERVKTRTVGESTSPSSPLRLEEAEERLAPSSQVSIAIKATNRDSAERVKTRSQTQTINVLGESSSHLSLPHPEEEEILAAPSHHLTSTSAMIAARVPFVCLDVIPIQKYLKRYKSANPKPLPGLKRLEKSLRTLRFEYMHAPRDRNQKKCKKIMMETFELRRQSICNGNFSVESTLAIYPPLSDLKQLRQDFYSIIKKNPKSLMSKVKECIRKRYTDLKSTRCDHNVCSEAVDILSSTNTSAETMNAAILVRYLCEQSSQAWINEMFAFIPTGEQFTGDIRPQPFVIVEGTPFKDPNPCKVFCGGFTVISSCSFQDAFFALYYLYYVFNMEYPLTDKAVFLEFDMILENFNQTPNLKPFHTCETLREIKNK